jgi:hypothetical protein
MWNVYLFRALDIAAERRREIDRDGHLRELRRTASKGPRPVSRRPLNGDDAGR